MAPGSPYFNFTTNNLYLTLKTNISTNTAKHPHIIVGISLPAI